ALENVACAILESGELYCWGQNIWGSLGYGDHRHREKPDTQPIDLHGHKAVQVSVAPAVIGPTICSILNDFSLRCWGLGALGYGREEVKSKPDPKAIDFDGKRVLQVAGGYGTTCVLLDDRHVYCWGSIIVKGLSVQGYGDLKERYVPPRQSLDFGGKRVSKIAMRDLHACARLEDGVLRCWGDNSFGQLGYGDKKYRGTPGEDIDLSGDEARDVVSGSDYTCAILMDGSMRCWGRNLYGQLGYPDLRERLKPDSSTLNFDGRKVKQLSLGEQRGCAVLDDRTIRCWGAYTEVFPGDPFADPLKVPLFESALRP
ncbi:MAG: hypothetical protein AAGJ35_07220, partial [Myxococcota bacterium]